MNNGDEGRVSPRLPPWKKILFSAIPLGSLLLVGELVARLDRGIVFTIESYRILRVDQARRGYPSVEDAVLGYAPRPTYSGRDNYWGKEINIDGHGLRRNGATSPPGEPIVAVGDSFTFGDQVSDDETWPAFLERSLDRPVSNGGVFGYSLGQAVLRAESILERVPAEWLILGLIAGDITRCEYSRRYADKPYFDLENDELVLRNVPVVRALPSPAELRSRRLKNAIGRSALLDSILAHTLREWWFLNQKIVRVHPEGTGGELAPKLVDRAVALCEERSCRLMIVALGKELDAAAERMLEHARALGVDVLDLVAEFDLERSRDPDVERRYFDGHMTAEGNRWVATHIADHIRNAAGTAAEPTSGL